MKWSGFLVLFHGCLETQNKIRPKNVNMTSVHHDQTLTCKDLCSRAKFSEGPFVKHALISPPADLSRLGIASMQPLILSSSGTPENDVHTPKVYGHLLEEDIIFPVWRGCSHGNNGNNASITNFTSATVLCTHIINRFSKLNSSTCKQDKNHLHSTLSHME